MPRKRKHHAPPELIVQQLSTGKIVQEKSIDDDFGSGSIPVAELYGPWKPPADLLALREARRKQAKLDKQALWDAIKIIPGHGPHLNKPKVRKPAFNQVFTESELVITIKAPLKPWRRM